jgi:CSLREA domain-containing protein
MVLDGERGLLSILDTSGKTESRSADVSFPSAPVAALTLPQKIDARRDTVVLTAGQAAPMVMREQSGGGDPLVTVNTTADTDGQGACGQSSSVTANSLSGTISLRTAVCAVNNSGAGTYTIDLPAGTYQLKNSFFGGKYSASSSGELQVGMENGENITISGAGAATTIIQQTDGVDRVIEADQVGAGGIPLTIQNVTLTGGTCSTGLDCGFSGGALVAGFYAGDSLTLTSVTVSNNSEQADTPALGGGNQGGGVSMAGPAFTITNSTFSGNSVTASSSNPGEGGGVEFLDDEPGNLSIMNSTFTGNTVAASSPEPASGGGLWIDLQTSGDTASVTGSTFTGNTAAGSNGEGGAIYSAGPTTVSNSRITGNTGAGGGSGFWEQGSTTSAADGTGTVKNNWWGCNGGPGASGCDTQAASPVSGDNASVVFNPWLVLSISANPTQIFIDATSDLTAGITTNSSGGTGFTVPDGTGITFGGTLGTDSPIGSTLTSGQATSTFTAGSTAGAGSGSAQVDNQTVTVGITIGDAPAITSGSSTTFTQNSGGSFTVTTSGFPVPSLSKSGALPAGVTFIDNGNGTATLAGTPTASGTFPLTITAANGFLPNATQSFTLTVNPEQVTLSISANPTAGGTVTPATGSLYTIGTVVPITATANSGYAFLNWASSPDAVASTTSASTTIPMNANETVTAQFAVSLVVNTATDDYPNDLSTKCTPQPTPGVNTIDTACSLRDAIDFANSAGVSSISFSSAVFNASNTVAENSIVLGGSALTINSGSVTINGPTSGSGATLTNLVTINGNLASTDLVVGAATATFNNLNIVNGEDSTYYTTLGYGIAGGVYNNGGTVTINTSTISGNVDSPLTPVYVYGGGVLNYSGTMTVTDSTISGNSAVASYSGFASYGGGIINLGTLTVSNSTISGNSATSGSGAEGIGGGITNSGPLTIASSTISLNTTTTGAGGIYDVTESGTNPVTNSIVSGNIGFSYPDIYGAGALHTDSTDQVTTGFALAPLAPYGGPTQTQPPLPGDPSFCGGTMANAVAAGLSTDQRGFGFDPVCTSGSVDSGAVQTHYTLGFNALPLNVIVGQVITPAPAVTLYESTVAMTAANMGGVTLFDTGATLSGTLTQTLATGTATFPGVSFASAGFHTFLMATLPLNASVSITGTRGATVTASPAPAVISAPSTSSPLPGPAATFTWNAVTGAAGYSLWIGTAGVGSHNLYDSGEVTGTSLKFGNLPTNGTTIYVRLYTNYHGVAQPSDYVYTASTQAALTLPSSPSVLSGATVTFDWSAATGSGVTGYSLWLGSSLGANNLYASHETTALTATATKLPTNSSTVYARLYTNYNGVVRYTDYTYTAAP